MLDHALSAQQLTVICALSSGANLTTAAGQAGVHRNTIANWRRNSLPFQQGLAHAQYDRALYFREKVEDQIDLAIQSIREILTDPKASPSLKLKAALTIITTAITPPPPKKQVELDIEKITICQAPPQTVTEEQFAPAQPEPCSAPPKVHKDAQPKPAPAAFPDQDAVQNPAPAPQIGHPKVGRNEACPCGSGKKYKRCCLNLKPSAAFVQRLACHVMPNGR